METANAAPSQTNRPPRVALWAIGALFIPCPSSLYYYRRTAIISLAKSYEFFRKFYLYLFSVYGVEYEDDVDDEFTNQYIQKKFSYKQQIYIWKFADSYLFTAIRLHLQCQKMKIYCEKNVEGRSLENTLPETLADLKECAEMMYALAQQCQSALIDPENKSTLFRDVITAGGYFTGLSSTLQALNSTLDRVIALFPKICQLPTEVQLAAKVVLSQKPESGKSETTDN